MKFSSDSQLESIERYAFDHSSIEFITIPSNCIYIKGYEFANCKHLRSFKFQSNSKLRSIGMNSFSNSSIDNSGIPANVKTIGIEAFYSCLKLKSVEFIGQFLYIDRSAFDCSKNLFVASFPLANEIFIEKNSFNNIYNDFSIYTIKYAKIIII